jgi:hypothetical protein
MVLLVRYRVRGADLPSALDGVMVAIGLGVLAWVFVMAPHAHDRTLSVAERIVPIAYPALDLLLVAVVVRLLLSRGVHNPSFRLLAVSVVALCADRGRQPRRPARSSPPYQHHNARATDLYSVAAAEPPVEVLATVRRPASGTSPAPCRQGVSQRSLGLSLGSESALPPLSPATRTRRTDAERSCAPTQAGAHRRGAPVELLVPDE